MEATFTTLKRRDIQDGIKKNWGYTKFEEKFGLDKQALEDAVHVLYKNNKETANGLIKDISKNEKREEKTRKKPTEYKGVPIEEFKNMSMDEFMAIENGTPKTPEIPEIVLLESEIHDLQDEVAKCESERKRWLARHNDVKKQMSELEEELKKAKEKLVSLKRKHNAISERDAKIVASANEILEKQNSLEGALEEKRQRLESLKRVVICAYSDGTVAPMEESVSVKLDETGSDELYSQLVNREECQDLKIREVRALAKLLKIVENSTLEFEVVCDNSDMEEAYRRLTQG